jgi:hypothetical protein
VRPKTAREMRQTDGFIFYTNKGENIMNNNELAIQNRINLLESRTEKENGNIVKKLQRQLRKLQNATPNA